MGQKIKDAAIYMVDQNKEYSVNVPKLLADLQMSSHITPIQAQSLDLLTKFLEKMAIRSCQINDAELLQLLQLMQIIEKAPPIIK